MSLVDRVKCLSLAVASTAVFTGNGSLRVERPLPIPGGPLALTSDLSTMLATAGSVTAFVTNAAKRPLGSANGPIPVAQLGCTAAVQITPFVGVHILAHHGDFGRNQAPGYVLAKIENVSSTNCVFKAIGLSQGHTAYWFVEESGQVSDNGQFRSRFVDVTGGETELVTSSHWTFQECARSHAQTTDAADILPRKTICMSHRADSAASAQTVQSHAPARITLNRKRRPFGPDDPLMWIACSEGCCYADQIM